MSNSISELEKELQEAEQKYRELAQLVEAAQENSEVLERLIASLEDELSAQSDSGKQYIINALLEYFKKYQKTTPVQALNFEGVVMLQERFGARKDTEGYMYFAGIDYRRVKGDNLNSTSVWRNFILQNHPSERVEIADNLKDSPVKGKYLVVGHSATLKDVATLAAMDFENPPRDGYWTPLQIDENLQPIILIPQDGDITSSPEAIPTEDVQHIDTATELPDEESPYLLIGKTIKTSAYGSEMEGAVTGYVDGDEKPWRVKVDDIPVELFLSRTDFEIV